MLKIEVINIVTMAKKLFHYTNSEQKGIDLDKHSIMKDALAYVEQHINEGDYEILDVTNTVSGTGYIMSFILTKK